MGTLRLYALAATMLVATPAGAQSVERWRPLIDEASARFGVPAAWIERVMRAESAGRTTLDGVPITSRAGAMGLMQLMPGTWAEMRRALGLGPNPHGPRDNILAGTAYLRLMYDRFGYPGLFGAYNAGPARYAAYLARTRALPGETRAYLAQVAGPTLEAAAPLPSTARIAPGNAIFFALRSSASEPRESPEGVFVRLGAETAFMTPAP